MPNSIRPSAPEPGLDAGPRLFKVSVDNCDREPIHIPGSIQASGALLTFEPSGGSVLHSSTNIGRWLPMGNLPAKGRALSEILGESAYERVCKALTGRAGGPVRHEVVDLPARPGEGQPQALEAIVHSHRGVCFLEIEPAAAEPFGDDWMQGLSDTVDALRSATGLQDLWQRMAQRVKRLTGFDRVMVYRFDEDHHGHVVADAREPDMDSLFDLHYPASDIPAQARELYVSNLVRYVADAGYVPVPVLPWIDTERLQPLDMSHATLRSVSPIHIQYLHNTGVASTLTLSLLVDGRLWGLIACHHRTPTALPIRLRRACYALSVTAGYMTGWFTSQARIAVSAEAAKAKALILEAFNQVQVPLCDVVEHCTTSLLQMVGASGGALWRGDAVLPFGQWPDGARGESVLRFVRHAFETSVSHQIDTEQAVLQPPLEAAELRGACGLIAIKFDGFASSGLVWLRPQHRSEVVWGGDPDKPVEVKLDAEGRTVLGPRSSFARWTTIVKGRSRPWTAVDREAVASLAILQQVLVVRESLAQISLSDRRFRSLVTLQSDAYWQTDLDGIVSTMSKPLPFDYPTTQGATLPGLFDGAGDCEGVAELRAALARGQRAFRALRVTVRRRGERTPLTFLLSGEPLRDIDGQGTGWHGTLTDITRDAQVAKAMQEKAAAELASLTKSKFLSQVSHELRTPLNAVLGFSQLVLTDPTTPLLQRTQIQHAYDAAQWLLTMITDLLDLSRIETGNLAVTMTAVDVGALLDEVKTMLAADAAKMAVEIELPGKESKVWVHADRARLYQVLVNLLSNAIKYNRRGGQARVLIREATAPDLVRITVEDSGAGLTEQQIEHLFEPFNRLGREGQSVSGSGIGLVITRHLVELIGGRIEVESRPGAGSRFSVDLRRADVGEAATPPVQAGAATLASQGELVLYVEDDPVNEMLMRAIVEGRLGRRYASATTAEEGLLLARKLRPAVLLVDLNLAGHDGVWLAEQVQGDPQLRGICLIAATADATSQTRARLLASGFSDCWIKPIDIKTVDSGLLLYAPNPPGQVV